MSGALVSSVRMATRLGRMYRIGEREAGLVLPSVTSVLSVLDKPGLVPWAVRAT